MVCHFWPILFCGKEFSIVCFCLFVVCVCVVGVFKASPPDPPPPDPLALPPQFFTLFSLSFGLFVEFCWCF